MENEQNGQNELVEQDEPIELNDRERVRINKERKAVELLGRISEILPKYKEADEEYQQLTAIKGLLEKRTFYYDDIPALETFINGLDI
jgi:hypothetical protein